MDVRISGKNLKITNGMKSHLEEKLEKLKKYSPGLLEAHAVLKKEKQQYRAEVTVHTKDFNAFGEGRERENIYTAMDQACERVAKQLKKRQERLKDHHRGMENKKIPSKVNIARGALSTAGSKNDGWKIVRMRSSSVKTMSINDASLRLANVKDSFLIFSNAENDRTSIIYKRPDGKHGLLEPEF